MQKVWGDACPVSPLHSAPERRDSCRSMWTQDALAKPLWRVRVKGCKPLVGQEHRVQDPCSVIGRAGSRGPPCRGLGRASSRDRPSLGRAGSWGRPSLGRAGSQDAFADSYGHVVDVQVQQRPRSHPPKQVTLHIPRMLAIAPQLRKLLKSEPPIPVNQCIRSEVLGIRRPKALGNGCFADSHAGMWTHSYTTKQREKTVGGKVRNTCIIYRRGFIVDTCLRLKTSQRRFQDLSGGRQQIELECILQGCPVRHPPQQVLRQPLISRRLDPAGRNWATWRGARLRW